MGLPENLSNDRKEEQYGRKSITKPHPEAEGAGGTAEDPGGRGREDQAGDLQPILQAYQQPEIHRSIKENALATSLTGAAVAAGNRSGLAFRYAGGCKGFREESSHGDRCEDGNGAKERKIDMRDNIFTDIKTAAGAISLYSERWLLGYGGGMCAFPCEKEIVNAAQRAFSRLSVFCPRHHDIGKSPLSVRSNTLLLTARGLFIKTFLQGQD